MYKSSLQAQKVSYGKLEYNSTRKFSLQIQDRYLQNEKTDASTFYRKLSVISHLKHSSAKTSQVIYLPF